MTMKRRLFSLFLMLIMMFSVGMTASAVYRPETGMPTINGTRSSAYLDGYSVGIEARGNGKIAVAMTVEARSKMEKARCARSGNRAENKREMDLL